MFYVLYTVLEYMYCTVLYSTVHSVYFYVGAGTTLPASMNLQYSTRLCSHVLYCFYCKPSLQTTTNSTDTFRTQYTVRDNGKLRSIQ